MSTRSKLPALLDSSWRKDKAGSTARGYSYKWQQARAAYLARHPLCAYCARSGRVTAASVVDHIEPHQGDTAKFWDARNWQALCATCHNSIKAEEEGRHAVKASFGPDGRVVWRARFSDGR